MRHRAFIALAVSGLIGFRLGTVAFPDWQVAVETAQVTAGLVTYPVATPFFLYHTKLWTVLHHVLAIFLRLGFSETQLSVALSGALGMVSLQALSMFVFALSDDLILAICAPLLIFVSRATDFGVVYPIMLMGSVHTYGIMGLSFMVLVVGLLGAGCYRSGAFLLGLAPAIHPSLGLWLFILVGVTVLVDLRGMRERAGHAGAYLIAGGLVTAASLAYQLASAYPAPPIDPALASRYLTTFVQIWDVHRQPVPMTADGMSLNWGALALALLWLIAFRSDLTSHAAFLLRLVVVASLLSLLLMVLSWAPPDRVPSSLLVLMPTRLANFNAMTFAALLLGLIGAYHRRPWGPVLLLAFSAALLLGDRSLLWPWLVERGTVSQMPSWSARLDFWTAIEASAFVLIVLTLLDRWRATTAGSEAGAETAAHSVPPHPLFRAVATAARTALVVSFIATGWVSWHRSANRMRIFDNAATGAVFKEASKGQGLLLTGGDLGLVQLRTRRPILLNGGGLDGLPYALDGGPETERILRDIYQIDFFNPPQEAYRSGVIPFRYNQTVWERYTPQQWHAIRYMYQVNQVITSASWQLNLPVIAQDHDLRLYQIPD